MNNMLEADNQMLWNGIKVRNFEEFWSINNRLMDTNTTNQSLGYRHLPIRLYKTDKTYSQPLVLAESSITVEELLETCAVCLDDNLTVISQGIEIPLDADVYELSQSLSYSDNFLYLCVVPVTSRTENDGS